MDEDSVFTKIEDCRIYAEKQVEYIRRMILNNEAEAEEHAGKVFHAFEFVSRILQAASEGGMTEEILLDTADELEKNPKEFSALRGLWFSPRTPNQAQLLIEKLAECLREHADLIVIRARYQQLHLKALDAIRLDATRGAAALRDLERDRDSCDTACDLRLAQRHDEMRRAPT